MGIRPISLISAAAALSAVLIPGAFAQKTVTATSGSASMSFSANMSNFLTPLGLSVGTVNPTSFSHNNTATLTLATGVVDLDSGAVNLVYNGGFTIEGAGSTTIRFQNLTIDSTGKTPVMTAIVVVNNQVWGRYMLFDLTPPASMSLPFSTHGVNWTLNGVQLALDPSASALLNSIYGVSQFSPGVNLATMNLSTKVSGDDWSY
ncbi:MAG TPA: hypothetical protein VGI45_10695 [Terracidiphilus sp.]|jgi:hypothetical protein